MKTEFIRSLGLYFICALAADAACRVPGSVSPRKIHRGMYVSLQSTKIGQLSLNPPLSNILGNTTSENVLLSFITKYQFDSLSLYDLNKIITNGLSTKLSNFIQAARACGVMEINAIGAVNTDWTRIQTYQKANSGKFSGLVTEIEFWNSANVSASFSSFITQLQYMQSLGVTPPIITPYIGWLNRDPKMAEAQEASMIAQNSGRVFVHSYVTNPSSAYSYGQSRIFNLTAAVPSLPIWPIFSAEGVTYSAGSEKFMGDWFSTNNTLDKAESIYMTSYVPAGFQYYDYTFLKLYLK
jgi:hypothetical protein